MINLNPKGNCTIFFNSIKKKPNKVQNLLALNICINIDNQAKSKWLFTSQEMNYHIYIYDVRVSATACKTGARVSISSHVKRERKRERKNGVNACRGIYDM